VTTQSDSTAGEVKTRGAVERRRVREVVRPLWAEIDLDALEANYREIVRRVGPNLKVIPSLKANAYGHGIVPVARALSAQGAYALACGSFDEAVAVRAAGVDTKILLFVGYLPETVADVLKHGFMPTIANLETAHAVAAAARRRTAIYVKVDSGLGRLGVPMAKAVELVKHVAALPRIVVEGIYTHLPFGDLTGLEWAKTQLHEFRAMLRALEAAGVVVSVTQAISSAGVLAMLEHGCNAICPGHLLYGLRPVSAAIADGDQFHPVLRAIRTRLIHVTRHPTPRAVGLGGRYPMPGGAVTGVVPIGSRDGYRAARVGTATMVLHGHRVPVLGVSLEHTTLDLSTVQDPTIGDEVLVLGGDGEERITLAELAEWQQASALEVLTAFSGRMPIATWRSRPKWSRLHTPQRGRS
jgi:alanine racemase